jgi:hypothetical protein
MQLFTHPEEGLQRYILVRNLAEDSCSQEMCAELDREDTQVLRRQQETKVVFFRESRHEPVDQHLACSNATQRHCTSTLYLLLDWHFYFKVQKGVASQTRDFAFIQHTDTLRSQAK